METVPSDLTVGGRNHVGIGNFQRKVGARER